MSQCKLIRADNHCKILANFMYKKRHGLVKFEEVTHWKNGVEVKTLIKRMVPPTFKIRYDVMKQQQEYLRSFRSAK